MCRWQQCAGGSASQHESSDAASSQVTCATFWPQWNCTTDGASGWLQDQTNANTPAQLTNGFRVICCRPTCAKRYTSDLQCSDPLQGSAGVAGWIRDPSAARTPITDLTTWPYNESDQKTCCNPTCTARYSNALCNTQQTGSVLRANASSIMLQDNIAGTDLAACCVTQQVNLQDVVLLLLLPRLGAESCLDPCFATASAAVGHQLTECCLAAACGNGCNLLVAM